MFNIGDEDKEKLKDNMTEIKKLIDKDEESPQQPQNTNPEFQQVSQQQEDHRRADQDLKKEELEKELESSLQDLDDEENNQSFDSKNNQQNLQQQNTSQKGQLNQQYRENTNQQEFNQRETEPRQETQAREPQTQQQAKTQQSQPNFSGNSLFLRVERFRKIEGMVSQMKDLTSQINRQIDNLERTNEQDEQIKQETHKILSEFSTTRQEMEESLMKNN